ncbi:mycothiol conjugate amidase Mca [Cnuibacter physcomitrellae]|uniref:mycothiol conjugate amidase Mca n=1 Tax=Cnuibacter physcomitrellae TaxID=1619308 RepID=UPI0021761102|nr:mycothiol conjugate amidase Mca [Cnuibacter physcomitrellae]MCS5496532.1 mycothiol conjugate amidase Mca [Cnuibacter physcomitrellae]
MAVHAHPDDESSKGAATYAYYLDRGVEVMVVSCTGGERGSILNESLADRSWAERDMAGLRRVEMAAAQKAVGFQHRWLGYHDSGLPEEGDPLPANAFGAIPVEISAAPLVRLIRRFQPQVLVTYDENGGYPHPDHIRCHEISMHAYEAAADAAAYPDAGEPWAVSKVYYDRIMNPARFEAVFDTLQSESPESPLLASFTEMREWMTKREQPVVTTRVPAGGFFEVRDSALRAHASQVAPDTPFFFWPNDMQRRAWPYEDFQLAASRISPLTAVGDVESDLFAGIEDA